MRPFQVPPLLLLHLLFMALLLFHLSSSGTAFSFPARRAVPSYPKPSRAHQRLSPLAATAATTSTSSTSSSSSSQSTGWTSSSPTPRQINRHPVLHALQQTASRAAPPGSTRRSLLKKVARGVLALGGGMGTATTAATAAGAAAVDRTPGKYKNLGSSGTDTLEREQQQQTISSSSSTNAADQKAKREVLETTRVWLRTVTSNRPTAAADTSALYAQDAVLWGTVSEQLRVTPSEIRSYFDFFAGLPGLRVAAYQPYVRVFGEARDMAINDGYYVFAWRGPDGVEVQKHARYSFVYRKEGGKGGEKWVIVDHHSSLLPTAPKGLVEATTVVL